MAEFVLGHKAAAKGYRLIGHDTVGSTSSEAAAAAVAGDPGDIWFAALQQTAGRGRRGRVWESPHGNLAASLFTVPNVDSSLAAMLGFVAGVALNRALREVLPAGVARVGLDGASAPGMRIALKWPNDILADGAKLAGILLEAQKLPNGRLGVVIGFGVNVVAAPLGLPYPATSLHALGADVNAEAIFRALSDSWVDAASTWNDGLGIADILAQWRGSAAGIGSEVAVSRDGEIVRGTFETVDETGRLIVRANDNARIAITAGDVHFGATASFRG